MKNYLLFILIVLWAIPASANTKTIEADYSLVMGDNMSKREARRICLAEAKRKLVEQAGVWLESETTIKNFKLVKDELRLFSAAFISPVIVEQSEKVDGSTFRFYTKVRANVSPERIRSQILEATQNKSVMAVIKGQQDEFERLRLSLTWIALDILDLTCSVKSLENGSHKKNKISFPHVALQQKVIQQLRDAGFFDYEIKDYYKQKFSAVGFSEQEINTFLNKLDL